MDAFDILQNFFYSLTTEETIWLLILGLLTFTVGLVLGWILQYGRTKRYRKQALLYQQEATDYEHRYKQTEDQLEAVSKELGKLSQEKVALVDQLQAARQELAARPTVTDEADRGEEIAHLERKIADLRTENERLSREPVVALPQEVSGTEPPAPEEGKTAGFEAYLTAIDARFQAFESRLDELSAPATGSVPSDGFAVPDNDFLEVPDDDAVPPPDPVVEVDANGEPLVIIADTAEPGVRYGEDGEAEVVVQNTPSLQTSVADLDTMGDDLTQIKTIGPFLQKQLNEADITRYEQIANWTEADIATYTEMLQYVPGAIESQDWVGQAKRLLSGATSEAGYSTAVESENAATEKTGDYEAAQTDKLRKIEGIGPKIEAILREAGVDSFASLADKAPDELREILVAASSRYKGRNPDSWPRQAALARDGDWDELARYQQELDGGRARK